MINSVPELFSEYKKVIDIEFKERNVEKNEIYAAYFFGLCLSMGNTYNLAPDIFMPELVSVFIKEFKFTEEHAGEYLAFLMQSLQPRVNPKFFAVIRLGMDEFYDFEDGLTDGIADTLKTLVDNILGLTESEFHY
ncbi:MAG: Imm48 family immunity protein [Oscillospiraceae bacterium]|nr:Imm48 family immunity protein [Oscillospiraceae bacterium]